MTFLSSGCLRAQRCGERTVGLLAWASSPADDPPDLTPRFSARYVRGLDGRDPHGDRPGRPVLVLASEPSMVRPARCRGEPAEPKSEHYGAQPSLSTATAPGPSPARGEGVGLAERKGGVLAESAARTVISARSGDARRNHAEDVETRRSAGGHSTRGLPEGRG